MPFSLNKRGTLCVLLFSFCLSSGIGCATSKRASNDTPVTNDSRILYTSVLKELITYRQIGLISDAEKSQIESIRKEVAAALDIMEQAELNNTDITVSKANVTMWLDKLVAWRVKIQQRR